MFGLALGLTALTSASMGTPASAQRGNGSYSQSWRSNSFEGVWRLDYGRSDRLADRFRDGNDRYDNDRYDNNRWGNDRNGRGTRLGMRLPEQFRIESDRRTVRIEDMSGRLIERASTSGRGNTFVIRHDGARDVVQRFTLEDRGRRLVVRTSIESSRGTREFSQVYHRIG
jgi:hypothetical protein